MTMMLGDWQPRPLLSGTESPPEPWEGKSDLENDPVGLPTGCAHGSLELGLI